MRTLSLAACTSSSPSEMWTQRAVCIGLLFLPRLDSPSVPARGLPPQTGPSPLVVKMLPVEYLLCAPGLPRGGMELQRQREREQTVHVGAKWWGGGQRGHGGCWRSPGQSPNLPLLAETSPGIHVRTWLNQQEGGEHSSQGNA